MKHIAAQRKIAINAFATITFIAACIISHAATASPVTGITTINTVQASTYHSAYTINNKKKAVIEQSVFNSLRASKIIDQIQLSIQKQISKILSTPEKKK